MELRLNSLLFPVKEHNGAKLKKHTIESPALIEICPKKLRAKKELDAQKLERKCEKKFI